MTTAARVLVAAPGRTAPWTRSLLGPWTMPALVVSAFLPYLHKGTGLRVENALGAALAVVALCTLLVRARLERALVLPLILCTALFVQVVLATTLGENDPVYLKSGIGRFDHYFRPVSVLLVAAVAFHGVGRDGRERALQQSLRVLLVGTSVNALLQLGTLTGSIGNLLDPFRPGTGPSLEVTVAELAALNNRFSGIFNQPVEHGLVYAVALLGCVYLWRRGGISPLALLVAVALLFVGGVLAFSKVFLLGGVPVAIVMALTQGGLRPKHLLGTLAAVAVLGAIAAVVLSRWEGAEAVFALGRMLADPERLLYALSGGRVGNTEVGEEVLVQHMLTAFRQSPLFGVGTATGLLLQDNEYTMTLAECGLVGLLLLLGRAVAMLLPAAGARWRDPALPLFVAIIVVTVGGAMGGPVSGIPRSGTVLWVFYALTALVLAAPRSGRTEGPA